MAIDKRSIGDHYLSGVLRTLRANPGGVFGAVGLLVLLDLAVYGLVSPGTPVRGITGLSTLGGFFGAVTELAGTVWFPLFGIPA